MIKTIKYILTLIFFYSCQLYAQTLGIVKGIVKDKTNNEVLPGATIILNKTNGTSTDMNGVFTLKAAEGTYELVCDLIGYTKLTQTITITGNDTTVVSFLLENGALTGKGNQLLDEVVISAGKFEQKLSDITVSMEVIKPALIENKNTTSLDMIMNQVPGVTVADGQASIRGGSGFSYGAGSRVLLLVDEMPMLSADANDIKWNYLPLENLEQVEVIKGASSALFGSSALNGAINLRTAYAKDKPVTKVTAFYGSYDAPKRSSLKWWKGSSQSQKGVSFSHAEKINNWDLVIGGNVYDDDGYRYLESEKRQRINANLRYNFKGKLRGLAIGANTNMMQTKGGLFFLWQNADSAYIPQGHDIQQYNNKRFNIDPYITYFFRNGGKISLRTRYFLTDNKNNKGQGARSELYYSELQYQKRFKNNLNVTAGLVVMEQMVLGDSLYGRHTGMNYAGYIQLDKKFGKLTTSLGLRGEYYKVDSAFTRGYISPKINNLPFQPVLRAGLNYQLFNFTFLRASFGQGYRFPSIAEKYISTNVSSLKIYPNYNLQPERGWSAEIGFKQGFGIGGFKGFLDVAGFWTEYQNMVEFVFDIYGPKTGSFFLDSQYAGFKSQNIGRARINGVDITLTGTGKIGPVNVSLLTGYTFTNPIDPNFNSLTDTLGLPGLNILKYRNQHLFKNDIQLDYKKFSLGFSTRYFSYMKNIDRRFVQSIFHEYNDPANGVNWDAVSSTYILPGLKEYREKNNKGSWIHDLRMSYQVSKILKASFLINNLFNVEYAARPGDVRPPRLFMMQLAFKV
ncbi:MAG: TonB-dependent receptor [Bacteroidota bacterium]